MVLEENDLSKLVLTKQSFKNLKCLQCKNKTNKQTKNKQANKQKDKKQPSPQQLLSLKQGGQFNDTAKTKSTYK